MAIVELGEMYSDKPLMIMLIGLPGSGKTTIAQKLAQAYNAVICSSDTKRKELYGDESIQGDPKEVFINLHKDILHFLREGKNVIYDATNIRRKNRESFLGFLKQNNVSCYRIAWVVVPPLEECLTRDQERERSVGKEVIMRMVQAFEFPQYFEGWNEILIWNYENTPPMYNRLTVVSIENVMGAFDQKNPWHFETVGKHCKRVQSLVIQEYDKRAKSTDTWSPFYHLPFQVAARYHDIGKLFTQTFDEKGVAHYYGHANVSAYYLASHLEVFPTADLTMEEIYFTLFLVNYHMLPYNLKSSAVNKKWKEKFGAYWFEALMMLHEADKDATSEEARNDTRRY